MFKPWPPSCCINLKLYSHNCDHQIFITNSLLKLSYPTEILGPQLMHAEVSFSPNLKLVTIDPQPIF